MLCIAMKEGGIVRIGDDIDIYVQQLGGGQVRLCLNVPRDIPIKHLPPEPAREAQPDEGAVKVTRRARRR